MQDCIQELHAIELCLSKYPEHKQLDLFLEREPEFSRLLSTYFSPNNQDLNSWTTQSYAKNESHPEHLKYKTTLGFMVRSKSELIISNSLSMNKLPFRYECGLNLNGVTLFPDFTIMHPKTKKLFYWEHFGMMDNPSYAHSAISKLQTYISNDIIPSINLITTFETKDNPLDTNMIEEIIKYYFL